MQELKPGQNLAGPVLFHGRLRAFGKCTNGVAFSKGRPNFQWGLLKEPAAALTVQEMLQFGATATHQLGPEPDKNSREYARFHKSRTGMPLLRRGTVSIPVSGVQWGYDCQSTRCFIRRLELI